jgi:hypothetical protein
MKEEAGTNAQRGNVWSRRSRKGKAFIIIGSALLAMGAIGAVSSPSETTASGTAGTSQAAAAPTKETKAPEAASNKATDDNEPHVGQNGSVIVDTLTWKVASVKQAKSLGNEYINETADGVFVIVGLRVQNGKDESVTINSDQVTLEVNGKEYSTDSDGTTQLMLTDDTESFFFKDLGPDVATTGSVVFDVPQAVLAQKSEVCFGELGFGSTKGCIGLSA